MLSSTRKIFFILLIVLGGCLWQVSPCAASDEWRSEFDRICGVVEKAGELSSTELSQLITDSNTLEKRIETEGGKEKKLYLFRLKKCRNFFQFILESNNLKKPSQ